MTDDDLKRLIDHHLSAAREFVEQEVDPERAEALSAYLGEPDGTEQEGYSQARSLDVEETIEWILPPLVDSFMIPQPVRFLPLSPEDVPQAQLETEYCRHVFFKQNDGFLLLYQWFKDALIQKNGIVRVYVDTRQTVETTTYRRLSAQEAGLILARDDVTPVEVVQDDDGTYTLEVTEKKTTPRFIVETVPPENFLVADDWASLDLDDCPFVAAFRDAVTASELREMGIDESLIQEALAASDGENSPSTFSFQGRIARRKTDRRGDDTPSRSLAGEIDPAQKTVTLFECYVLADRDGDGVAERLRVLYANGVVLHTESISDQPFVAITPSILSHRFWGRSVADQVIELQRVKTAILRQTLDNLYLANRPQRVVVDGAVNPADLKKPAIDRVIRASNLNAISILQTPFIGGESLTLLQYLDKAREMRTGVGPAFTGQSYELSTQTAHGVERMMTAAEQKVRLIARVFAEVGLRKVYLKLHRLIRTVGIEQLIELDGRWMRVDPTTWRERNSIEAAVGLGYAARMERAAALQTVLQMQLMLLQQGGADVVVSLPQVYQTLIDYAKAAGLERPEVYFIDPTTPAAATAYMQQRQLLQQQQIAQVQALQTQTALSMQKAQLDAQIEAAKVSLEARKVDTSSERERARLEQELVKLETQRAQLETKMVAEEERLKREAAQAQFRLQKEALEVELAADRAELDQARSELELESKRAELEARIQQANAMLKAQELKHQAELIKLEQEAAKTAAELAAKVRQAVSEPPSAGPTVQEIQDLAATLRGPRQIETTDDGMPRRIVYPDGSYREVIYRDGQAVGLSDLRSPTGDAA